MREPGGLTGSPFTSPASMAISRREVIVRRMAGTVLSHRAALAPVIQALLMLAAAKRSGTVPHPARQATLFTRWIEAKSRGGDLFSHGPNVHHATGLARN
jgi:hypothetical protein